MNVLNFMRSPSSVRLLVDYGVDLGLTVDALLEGSRALESQLEDPNADISGAQEIRVIQNLIKLSCHKERLGLTVGQRYKVSVYGMWGYGLISSATLGDAVQHAMRFMPLTFAFTSISHHLNGSLAVLNFEEPEIPPALRTFVLDRDMAAAVVLIRELLGDSFSLQQVTLREHAPKQSDIAELTQAYGVMPHFSSAANSLTFDAGLLAKKLPQANRMTAVICEQMCNDLLERRRARQGSSAIVTQYLGVRGEASTRLASMAQRMNTSTRTLKRRLKDEGTSFRALLKQSQTNTAMELLQDRSLSISDIAQRMGFSDASSFSQTFKRWFGTAPNLYRKDQLDTVNEATRT